jgi:glycosyltransferase involved in cell wall biosynthesis
LSSTVLFLGFKEDVRPFLAAADIFVLPSRTEGLPFSLLEAMSSGLACVATDVGAVGEVISDGVDGLIVPPESPMALAEAIRRLLCDAELRSAIGKHARARIQSDFDQRKSLAAMVALLLGSELDGNPGTVPVTAQEPQVISKQ